MSEREQLIVMWQSWGSPSAQAAVLADQLIKRCDQLVVQRGWTRVQAMEHLLRLILQARAGVAPDLSASPSTPSAAEADRPGV